MKPTTFFSLGYVDTKLVVTWALCMRGGCQLAEQGQLATRLTVAAAHPNQIWAQLDRRWVALHGEIPALKAAVTLSHMRAAGVRSWGLVLVFVPVCGSVRKVFWKYSTCGGKCRGPPRPTPLFDRRRHVIEVRPKYRQSSN